MVNGIGWDFIDRTLLWISDECRARLHCMCVQADFAPHSLQDQFRFRKAGLEINIKKKRLTIGSRTASVFIPAFSNPKCYDVLLLTFIRRVENSCGKRRKCWCPAFLIFQQ